MFINQKNMIRFFLTLSVLTGLFFPLTSVQALPPAAQPAQSGQATAYDLIVAMNTLRVSYGLPALVEDPIIDAVAQATAETMAASNMSWHIGNASGRVQAAGYGGGAKVWATENFSSGFDTLDKIMQVWSDPSHMIPAVNPAYCNIGAGMAKSPTGVMYYVLQAAYIGVKACGEYTSVGRPTLQPGGTTGGGTVPQRIVPVKIATPDADGRVFHVVEAGQTLWAIAVTYKVTVKDLQDWNAMSSSTTLPIGKRLLIPGSNTKGYSTPTPVGMVQASTPEPDGRIIHVVQPYQYLTPIAQAYGVKIETILALNGIQIDLPLQVGQKLLISPGRITPSPTPRPLTPIEKLTPASDGKYYHTVKSGESLSWIADLYKVAANDLMAWSGLNAASVLQPGQKLLLQVTPPATQTSTSGPPTATLEPSRTATQAPATQTATPSPTPSAGSSTVSPAPVAANPTPDLTPYLILGACAAGLFLIVIFSRRPK
jgi:LysM repeat protein